MTKGIDMLVKVDNMIVALQKGATLNRSVETIDRTTKQSQGWKEFAASFKEWSIECDGLYTIPASANGTADQSFDILEDAFENGEEVQIEFTFVEDPANPLPPDIMTGWTGNALIIEFPLEAPQDDSLTFTVSFQGTGPLQRLYSV